MRWPWAKVKPEERSIDKMDLWGKGLPVDLTSDTGIPVSRESAARVVAVYACVRIRAEAIAGLPADVFRKSGTTRVPIPVPPIWLRNPNPEATWFEFVERLNTSLDLDGNAYLLITARDRLGFPAEVWTLHPDQVDVRRRERGGGLFYVWNGELEFTPFDSQTHEGQILHIKNLSWGQDKAPSPVGVARQAIGLSIATEKDAARFFGAGQNLSGVIQLPPAEGGKTAEFIDQMREHWTSTYGGVNRSHLPGVLTGGATWTPIRMNNDDAQFLESRKFQVEEIARLYGVPPHMIGDVERSTSWGTGIEQQGIGFVIYALGGRLARLEAMLNQLLPRGQYIKFNVNGLLRGDSAARSAFYEKGIRAGWLLRSEARQLEDLPEEPGIDDTPEPVAPTPGGNEEPDEPAA